MNESISRILGALLATVLIGGPAIEAKAALAIDCSPSSIRLGTCNITGKNDGTDVTIRGNGTTPGSGGNSGNGSEPQDPYADCIYILNGRCLMAGPDKRAPTAPVTLSDIAKFRPNPGRDLMEPDGWMIVGLDTNFYSTGGIQVHDGTLFAAPASVRFTPVSWHWDYGDGVLATRARPGRAWAASGVAEFGSTSTSHVFRNPGRYLITLSIDFSAEYRVAGLGWTPIDGLLNVPANPLTAVAGSAKTVLVERGCIDAPSGPGC